MSAGLRSILPRRAWWLVPPVVVAGIIAAWFALDPGFRGSSSNTAAMPGDAFEQRVRDYLLKNPEVIIEAVQRLEGHNRAAEEGEAQAALKSRADEVFHAPRGRSVETRPATSRW